MDTGGLLVPYNLVWSQRQQEQDDSSYRVRYVETASTKFLSRAPTNDTLHKGLEFDAVMGAKAVDATRHIQASLQPGENPYEPYQKHVAVAIYNQFYPSMALNFLGPATMIPTPRLV